MCLLDNDSSHLAEFGAAGRQIRAPPEPDLIWQHCGCKDIQLPQFGPNAGPAHYESEAMTSSQDITLWLGRLSDGDPDALDGVVRLLYDELRVLARSRIRGERVGHTLAATALVNEMYLKLADQNRINADDRLKFMAVAATTMRRVLVDYARARLSDKRGGGAARISLEEAEPFLTEQESDEVQALDAAIDRLASFDERAANVVVKRFYAGFSVEEIAGLLGVSTKTVQRDWLTARAWLRKEVAHELGREPDLGPD